MWEDEQLASASEVTPREIVGMVWDFQPALIVIEAFSLRSPRWTNAQSRQALETVKLIGGIETLALLYGGVVVEQQPSVRHVAQSSKYWRELQRTSAVAANSHARSAVAHGLYYLHFAKR